MILQKLVERRKYQTAHAFHDMCCFTCKMIVVIEGDAKGYSKDCQDGNAQKVDYS